MSESQGLLLFVVGLVVSSIAVGVVFTETLFPIIAGALGISVLIGGGLWFVLGAISFILGMIHFNNEVEN